jgi:hypothetical protein
MDVVWKRLNRGEEPQDVLGFAYQAFTATWVEQGMKEPTELSLDELSVLGTKTPGIAKEMLWNYIQTRQNFLRNIELLEVEQPFVIPLWLDGTSIMYCGRRDKVFRADGQVICGEHKTTGSYKAGGPFRTDYLEGWHLDSQIDGYQHSLYMTYPNDSNGGVWVDAALCHKKVHDGFRFIPVSKTPGLLNNWLFDTRQWIDKISVDTLKWQDQPKDEPLACFAKNTNACDKWRGCSYRDICRFNDMPHQLEEPPQGFMVEKWSPFDKLGLAELNLEDEDA